MAPGYVNKLDGLHCSLPGAVQRSLFTTETLVAVGSPSMLVRQHIFPPTVLQNMVTSMIENAIQYITPLVFYASVLTVCKRKRL